MSAIYNLEPQPTASAIIHTTQGEISVELFAKQTPLTCRNFLQLALDGYYDGTIFHRLIPGFILQGGDPTGTGHGGESIYDGGAFSGDLDPWPMDQRKGQNAGPMGIGFKDEFHSRLKFNRRGLLGMANEGTRDTNGSQFFFTLGKADELTNKNTVFGRVAGDTIYNLAKMGEAEVEEGGERPLYPVKITRIEILINPFDDMKKREKRVKQQVVKPGRPAEKKQKKRKGGKQLLSFGDDEGDGDDLPALKKTKYDARIVMDVDEEPAQKAMTGRSTSKKDAKPAPPKEIQAPAKQAKEEPKTVSRPEPVPVKNEQPKRREVDSPVPEPPQKKSLLERTNEEIAAVKASMKRTIYTEPVKETKKLALEEMIPETAIRGRKRRPGGDSALSKELNLLMSFKSKLEQAPEEKNAPQPTVDEPEETGDGEGEGEGEVCDLHFIANCLSCRAWDKEDKEESDDEGWMSHKLSCVADKLGKDLNYRKKAEEELVVIDPLEKARNLKEGKKPARDARAGGSSRAWDQDRDRGHDRDRDRGRDRRDRR
ncbi:cyclophilin-like domain-containing protein [Cladorrhinum sp. PSN332]|nr:cyclophilin-like domain-containing protein [Cladorrhinum sp. PSN332]